MKPFIAVILALVFLAVVPSVRGQDRAQVNAATASAVANLRRQVDALPLGGSLTVGQFIAKTQNGDDLLTKTLQRAEMVGGPRWLDDQTVEVRLEIAGVKVSAVLGQIAASITSKPYGAVYTPEYVVREARVWENRVFSGTGTATGAGGARRVRPPVEDANWAPVPDEVRRQAIDAARVNANATVLGQVAEVRTPGNVTVQQLVANAAVNQDVTTFLNARPVRSVEFADNRVVTVTLGMRGEELADVLRASAVRNHIAPDDAVAWQPTRQEFAARVTDPRGLAIAGLAVAPAAATRVIEMHAISFPTDRPPEWVFRQLDAEGTAVAQNSKLRTARAAERDALQKLREQLEGLPLAQGITVGGAGKSDSRVRDAVDHTLDRARTYKVDYKEDGSAAVNVSVEAGALWSELTQGR